MTIIVPNSHDYRPSVASLRAGAPDHEAALQWFTENADGVLRWGRPLSQLVDDLDGSWWVNGQVRRVSLRCASDDVVWLRLRSIARYAVRRARLLVAEVNRTRAAEVETLEAVYAAPSFVAA